MQDVFQTEKVESSLQETWESVAAQEDLNNVIETEALIVNKFEMPSPLPSPEQSVSSRPPSVSSASSGGRKRNKVMCQDDEFLHLEKRKLELLGKDSEREEDEDLLFLKSLLPDIKSLPRWRKRRLRLKIHQLVIQEMEEAESHPEPTNSAPRRLLPS
jgi:hypothetical protein